MLSFKSVFASAVLASLTAILQLPAMAQFEISPDHFSDADHSSDPRTASLAERPGEEMARVQQELESYYSAIQHQTDAVNSAQEAAAGAGGMGESAYIFIDEYVRQERELEELRKELTPRIVLAETRLDALKQAQLATSSPAAVPVPRKAVAATGGISHRGVLMASVPKQRK
jgi:hypothetical protein